MVIAFGAPEDIFQRLPVLDVIARVVSDLVPSIDKWSERSLFPSMTRLLFVYLWAIIPYWIWIYLIDRESSFNATSSPFFRKGSSVIRQCFGMLFLVMVFFAFFLIFYLFSLPVEPDCRNACIHESRFLHFFCGASMSVIIRGLASAVLFRTLKLFKQIFHSDKGEA
jgi:hypothetical protein